MYFLLHLIRGDQFSNRLQAWDKNEGYSEIVLERKPLPFRISLGNTHFPDTDRIHLYRQSSRPMQNRSPKILLVDDNDLMRTLLRGILRSESCQVVGEAKNGLIALDLIERVLPDVVFLDVMMPEMDGLEALQNIKEKHPEIRVIMITGNPSVENVQESIQGGASGFIVKPFNTAKVLDTLHKTLDNMSRETQ